MAVLLRPSRVRSRSAADNNPPKRTKRPSAGTTTSPYTLTREAETTWHQSYGETP